MKQKGPLNLIRMKDIKYFVFPHPINLNLVITHK